jgi:hypothetical protein
MENVPESTSKLISKSADKIDPLKISLFVLVVLNFKVSLNQFIAFQGEVPEQTLQSIYIHILLLLGSWLTGTSRVHMSLGYWIFAFHQLVNKLAALAFLVTFIVHAVLYNIEHRVLNVLGDVLVLVGVTNLFHVKVAILLALFLLIGLYIIIYQSPSFLSESFDIDSFHLVLFKVSFLHFAGIVKLSIFSLKES